MSGGRNVSIPEKKKIALPRITREGGVSHRSSAVRKSSYRRVGGAGGAAEPQDRRSRRLPKASIFFFRG